MKFKNIFLISMATTMASCGGGTSEIYKDPSKSAHERAVDIVSRLTLDEKVLLMQHASPEIERLGIKQYNWWNEALHGVGRAGLATVFPQPIGMAASFDDDLILDVFTAVSDEARAKNQLAKQNGKLNIYQGLTFWTPNINIFRDPRWGRGHETYGEDPFLTSRMGVNVVKGLQGDISKKYHKLHACAKHFAVHSGPEWNRHTFDAKDISSRDLYETYLPAFKALVQEAGVKEVMCAYNRYEGKPCCGNDKLLNHILRNEWGYKGIVLSDCWAINDFWNGHQTDPDDKHATAKAVRSGTDLECGNSYGALVDAVSEGLVDESKIDESLIRLFTARYELGEMDDDNLVEWTKIPYSVVDSKEHQAIAAKMTRETMVLLKNNGILPLKNDAKVALMGPNGNDSIMQWGNYNGFPSKTTTLLEALQKQFNGIVYEKACEHTSADQLVSYFEKLENGSMKATYYNSLDNDNLGEIANQLDIKTPMNYTTLGATVFAPNVKLGGFTGIYEGKYIAKQSEKLNFSLECQGQVFLYINEEEVFKGGNLKCLNAYQLDVEKGKEYAIKVKFRASEGECASLRFDFGKEVPADLNKSLNQVKDAEIVIFAGGLSPLLEGEEMPVSIYGFRGGDRDIIELPKIQTEILQLLKKQGKKIVMINFSGSAVGLEKESELCDAIIQAWYPGQDGGNAIVDVLMGKYNPAGRLPITFYKNTAQLPDFQDYNMTNRTYRYFKGEAEYAFGFGLSYTKFEYSDATISKVNDGNYIVNFEIKNVGDMDGEEVAQLYIENPLDKEGPKYQLRAFKRVMIKKGETAKIEFSLGEKELEWFNQTSKKIESLTSNFNVLYGSSSLRKDLKSIEVK